MAGNHTILLFVTFITRKLCKFLPIKFTIRLFFPINLEISIGRWVTLHLPPPETLTLESNLGVFSKIVTSIPGPLEWIAAKYPAAPPPITATFNLYSYLRVKEL